MADVLSRRDRVRADTVREIKETARRVLVEQGVDGLSLRAIAREMGMTAPALYRYFPSREDLIDHLISDLYDEVSAEMEAARDAEPEGDVAVRLLVVSRTFRHWALRNPREFALLFGSPVEGPVPPSQRTDHREGPADAGGQRFAGVFGGLVTELYLTRPFPIPADEQIEPVLREQLAAWRESWPVPLPLGVLQIFLSCWIRLYGSVCMELFGHLAFALQDAEPMFESELRDLGERIGIPDAYRPPGEPGAVSS
jgi:AcrR family transcriptional regulator